MQTATALAKEYLSENYSTEMTYLKCIHNLIDGDYSVYFSPVGDDDLVFSVSVSRNLTKPKKNRGENRAPDNYLNKLYGREYSRRVAEIVSKVYQREVVVNVAVGDTWAHRQPGNISENSSFEEMRHVYSQRLYPGNGIDTNASLSVYVNTEEYLNIGADDNTVEIAARNIYESAKALLDEGYCSEDTRSVVFIFRTTDKSRGGEYSVWFSAYWDSEQITINQIDSVEQVAEQIRIQLSL
jgi:hypothetical protein